MHSNPNILVALTLVAGLATGYQGAYAQLRHYPAKPIRIVTTEPGGGSDAAVRIMQSALSGALGQPLVVDNRGVLGADVVARAQPDGYTILSYGSTIWISPLLRAHVAYDVLRDFAPITLGTTSPGVIVVHPSLSVKSVKDLIALAKSRPGEFNYASGSTGSGAHLTGELFKVLAGVNIVRIAFKGSGPGLVALIAGEVQMSFPNAGTVAAHMKSGKVRALAVTTLHQSALTPGLPTAVESGLPGFVSTTPFGYFAPAGTPPDIIGRLHKEIAGTLRRPEVTERLLGIGMEVVANTPREFAAFIKSEVALWGKVIKNAGIRED